MNLSPKTREEMQEYARAFSQQDSKIHEQQVPIFINHREWMKNFFKAVEWHDEHPIQSELLSLFKKPFAKFPQGEFINDVNSFCKLIINLRKSIYHLAMRSAELDDFDSMQSRMAEIYDTLYWLPDDSFDIVDKILSSPSGDGIDRLIKARAVYLSLYKDVVACKEFLRKVDLNNYNSVTAKRNNLVLAKDTDNTKTKDN